MIRLRANTKIAGLIFGLVLFGVIGCGSLYGVMRSASVQNLVFQTGLCDWLSFEQFNAFVSSFETSPKTYQLENKKLDEVRQIKIRRVLEITQQLTPFEQAEEQEDGQRKETFTFLPSVEECRMARFHLLVEPQNSLEPCILEVVQAHEDIASGLRECGSGSTKERIGDVITCARLRVCDLRFAAYREHNLLNEFPRVAPPAPPAPLADEAPEAADEESLDQQEEEAPEAAAEEPSVEDVEPDDGFSEQLAELLDESAHGLLKSFSLAVEMPPTNLFRALFPLPAVEMSPSPTATLDELIRWLESNAYARIKSTQDLRFGDVLVGFHFDQRALRETQVVALPDGKIEHIEATGYDHLGIYLGRGLAAVPSPNRCGMTVIPLRTRYASAYRIVPGFALAEYRLPMSTIVEYANDCSGYFLLYEGEG